MIEFASGAVSVGQWKEAEAGDPVVLTPLARVGRVTQTEHSYPHIQNIARHQKIHYCCLDAYIDLPIIIITTYHNEALSCKTLGALASYQA